MNPLLLNSTAVSFLGNKSFSKSISMLRAAIRSLQDINSSNVNKVRFALHKQNEKAQDCLVHQCIDQGAKNIAQKSSPHNTFQVMAEAFEFGSGFDSELSRHTQFEVATSVTLYNLGLTLHLMAIRKNKSKLLLEALKYYGLAYENFKDIREELFEALSCSQDQDQLCSQFSDKCTAQLATFLSVLVTNIGHIQSTFFDTNCVQHCLLELGHLIYLVRDELMFKGRDDLLDTIVMDVTSDVQSFAAAMA